MPGTADTRADTLFGHYSVKIRSSNGLGPQAAHVLRILLAVDKRKSPGAQASDEMDQGKFRRIAAVAEHGLAEEHAADRDTV